LKLAWLMAVVASSLQALNEQDLSPRTYVITPLHADAVTLTWSFYDGSINFNDTIPVNGGTGTYSRHGSTEPRMQTCFSRLSCESRSR
jgi:hypothetical protein